MKKILYIIVLISTIVVLPVSAYSNIAVVDMDGVIQKSKVWEGVKYGIENYAQLVQRQVMTQQVNLEKIWVKIKKMRKNSKQVNELVKLEDSFKKGRAESQKYVQQQKKKMDNAFKLAKDVINKKIYTIIKNIAKKNKYNIVLNSSVAEQGSLVAYSKKSTVITNDVLKILDLKMPSIRLQFSGK